MEVPHTDFSSGVGLQPGLDSGVQGNLHISTHNQATHVYSRMYISASKLLSPSPSRMRFSFAIPCCSRNDRL